MLETRPVRSRSQNGTTRLLASTIRICMFIAIGTGQWIHERSVACSCLELTDTLRWSRAVLELSTRGHKCSTFPLAWSRGYPTRTKRLRTPAGKSSDGVATLPSLTQPVVALSSTMTTCSSSTLSPNRSFWSYRTGALGSDWWMLVILQL